MSLEGKPAVEASGNRSSNGRREASFRNAGRESNEMGSKSASHAADPEASANAARTSGSVPDDEMPRRGGISPAVAVTCDIYPPVRRRTFLSTKASPKIEGIMGAKVRQKQDN